MRHDLGVAFRGTSRIAWLSGFRLARAGIIVCESCARPGVGGCDLDAFEARPSGVVESAMGRVEGCGAERDVQAGGEWSRRLPGIQRPREFLGNQHPGPGAVVLRAADQPGRDLVLQMRRNV